MEQFIYKTKYQYLTNIMLNVTDDCNLACRYCFVEQHPHYMTFDIAKQVVEFIIKNKNKKEELGVWDKNDQCRIYFFGGEPTLCFNTIIKPTVEYCNLNYPNIFNFGITTNGTLLNKEKIDFFKDNNFDILLSIDGNKITQDYNRPCKNNKNLSSFDLIKKNIDYLLEKYPNIKFRSTIYPDTVKYLYENYKYAESLGFRNWIGVEDARHPWTLEQINTLKEQMAQIYFYRLTQIIQKEKPLGNPRFSDWLRFTVSLYKNNTGFNIDNWKTVERCGLGTTIGSISWDGTIYGCQEQVSKDQKNIFLIGNLFDGIDIEKHTKLLQFYYNNQLEQKIKKEECNICPLKSLCQLNIESCPSTLYDLYSNMNSMPEINCQMRKIYYNNSLLSLKLLLSLNDNDINQYLFRIIQGEGKQYGR